MKLDSQFTEEMTELANDLIAVSKIRKLKYQFQRIHLDKLIEKWKLTDSKYEIHLFDLDDDIIVDFNKTINKRLCKILDRKSNGFEIRTLKKIKTLLPNINELEKNVIGIRTRRSKPFKTNGLPIKLNENNWAYIFGYLPDAGIRRFSFYSKNDECISEVENKLNELGCCYSKFPNNIVGNKLFTRIISLSGFDIHKKQTESNNVLPSWIFTKTSEEFKRILIGKFFESEGYLAKDSRQANITQSSQINLNDSDKTKIMKIAKKYVIKPSEVEILKLSYNKTPQSIKEQATNSPCLILVSLQLLLKKLEVNSSINPEFLYIKADNSVNIMWNLRIFGTDLNNFIEMCSDYIRPDKLAAFRKRRECLSRNSMKLFYLLHAKNIEDEQRYFTIENLIDITGRKRKSVYNIIPFLEKGGFIRKSEKDGRVFRHQITNLGLRYLEENNINI